MSQSTSNQRLLKVPKRKDVATCFICDCGMTAWANRSANLICGDCLLPMMCN